MEVLVMAAQLILGLSILVGLHELGHLLTAKLFGMKVEQYSIGFPPKIFGFKYGETEYSLGAIPLGGFVKISGMVDESLDTDYLNKEPQPWEFRAKPAWQRLIVMMGGIIVNVITGIVIFIILLFMFGRTYLPASEAKYGVVAYDAAKEIGLRTGDKILEINGKPYKDFYAVSGKEVMFTPNSYYTVERNGQTMRVDIPSNLIEKLSDKRDFIEPRRPFVIDSVITYRAPTGLQKILLSLGLAKKQEKMPAEKAGLLAGDKVVELNGKPITFYDQFQEGVQKFKGDEITLGILRGTEKLQKTIRLTEDGTIGVYPASPFNLEKIDYTLGMAVQEGPAMAFGVVRDNIRAFGKIFRGEVSFSKSMSGPVGIAKLYGGIWNWERFWSLTALLSMILAFMNFLPIPALDGGHVMFLTYEMISGRSPSEKFLEVAQKVGMVILLGLMVFAFFNDIFKTIFPS